MSNPDKANTANIEAVALNDTDAAAYIGMSASWLRQARSKGSLEAPPFLKIGKSVRYLQEDLDAWLDTKRKTNTLQLN